MKLTDYIRGNRKGPGARRIELDALGDPFLEEALEGFDSVEADHRASLDRLSRRLERRIGAKRSAKVPRKPVWRRPALWTSAAALALSLVLTGLIYRYSLLPLMRQPQYAAAPPEADDYMDMIILPEIELDTVPITREAPSPPQLPAMTLDMVLGDDLLITEPLFDDFSEGAQTVEIFDQITFEEPTADTPVAPLPERATEQRARAAASQSDAAIIGRVTDPYGKPIPGVSVTTDRSKGALTDVNGYFVIFDAGGSRVIQASGLGYETMTVRADPGSEIRIILEEAAAGVDEVVVLGQGSSKKSAVTGSVSPVEAFGGHSGGRFVETAPGAVAYFGLNVSGSSFGKLRDALGRGRLPAPGTVRVEQVVNHFTYYAPSGDTGPVNIAIGWGECPWEPAHLLLGIAVHTGTPLESARVGVSFDPFAVRSYRLIGYEGKSGNVTDAGEYFPADGSVIALFEIIPSAGAIPSDLGTVNMSYRESGARKRRSVSVPLESGAAGGKLDIGFASAVAWFALSLQAGEPITGARYEALHALASTSGNPGREEFLDLLSKARQISDREGE